MARFGIGLPRAILYLYAAATLVEVALERDDFPLSRYPMFSLVREARPTYRKVLTVVNDAGEQPVKDRRALFGGDHAERVIFRRATGPQRRKEMLAKLAKRVDKIRVPGGRPFAIRFYAETTRDGKPVSRMLDAVYAPPPDLLARLAEEQRATAAPLRPEKTSRRDRLVDLDDTACVEHCSKIDDRYASAGTAIRLEPSKGGTASVAFTMPAGTWFVLARMRTRAAPPNDVVVVELEGRPTKKGRRRSKRYELGNYKASLPAEGWVWSSSRPGWPALELGAADDVRVTLVSRSQPVDIDQIWLSAKQSELPTNNAPVVVPRKKRRSR